MSSKRWNSTEKIQLLKLFADKLSYDDIGKKLDRSANAVKLRIESIVYDNIVKEKDIHTIAKLLNTSNDKIIQMYYSHKSFKQGKGEQVKDIQIPQLTQHIPTTQKVTQQSIQSEIFKKNIQNDNRNNNGIVDRNDDGNGVINTQSLDIGGMQMKISMGMKDIEKMEKENKILEIILKNQRLKNEFKKVVSSNMDISGLNKI